MKRLFFAFATALCLTQCSSPKSEPKDNDTVADSTTTAIDSIVETQAQEAVDWKAIMPKIVNNLPADCLTKDFSGLVGKGNLPADFEHESLYEDNIYTLSYVKNESHYEFYAMAAKVAGKEKIHVVTTCISGLDGAKNDKITTMVYDIETGTFADITDGFPGAKPTADDLNLAWFNDYPELAKRLKASFPKHQYVKFNQYRGVPMIEVVLNDIELMSEIEEHEYHGVSANINVTYLWDGNSYVKQADAPYNPGYRAAAKKMYSDYLAQLKDLDLGKVDPTIYFDDYLKEMWNKAGDAAQENGEDWLGYDPWLDAQDFDNPQVVDVLVVESDNYSALLRVIIQPFCNEPNIISVSPVRLSHNIEDDTYLIDDFTDNRDYSICRIANRYLED